MEKSDHTGSTEGLKALRDFFFAVDAADLAAAAESLSRHTNTGLGQDIDWVEVEYDFNRLFVGPAAIPAPPYASAYQDEPLLMGKPTLEVRELYHELGLAVPGEGTIPDDHLAFELDAVILLESLVAETDNTEAARLRDWLINEHMGQWVPRFIDAIKSQDAVSAPIEMAADALKLWLDSVGNN